MEMKEVQGNWYDNTVPLLIQLHLLPLTLRMLVTTIDALQHFETG